MQKFLVSIAIVIFTYVYAEAQQFGIKTNLIYDATASPSLGAEISVAPKWSLELTGNLNAWDMSHDRKWKHWFIQPEVRYWLCEALHGHFFGMHLLGGQYNFGGFGYDGKLFGIDFDNLRTHRHQGWAVGGGFNYGYAWLLQKHWNIEAELGVGYLYTRYDEYQCAGCGKRKRKGVKKNYVGPTEIAVNLEYLF